MKLFTYGTVFAFVFASVFSVMAQDTYAESNDTSVSISELIELLIALEIIPEDKADAARTIAEERGVERDVMAHCLQISRNLYMGVDDASTAGEVTKLQQFLKNTGDYDYPKVTGYFGPATEAAVQRWQKRMGVVSSGSPDTNGFGLVGPMTRAKMACKVAKQVQKEEKKEVKEEKKEQKKEEKKDDKDDVESTVTEITLSADEDKSKVYWDTDGVSPKGYKVVWSLEENPTYPLGSDDKYIYVTGKGDGSQVLTAFDGAGTYYVRVCEYLGSECGVYSNQVTIVLNDEDDGYDEPYEGNVEEITLRVDEDDNSVWWDVDGRSSLGYKVVWSLEEGPEYPTRDGDEYKYYTSPNADHARLTAFDGAGTYYVRVCEYLGEKCGIYSNEVSLEL